MNTSGVIYVVSFQRCGLPQLGNWLIVCSMLGDNVFCSDTVWPMLRNSVFCSSTHILAAAGLMN